MTKRRKLVAGPVTRMKTEVKEEKVIMGKYLYTQVYLRYKFNHYICKKVRFLLFQTT